jgi:uncharacterized SAM-binding protein YcdF (DUF218 family)
MFITLKMVLRQLLLPPAGTLLLVALGAWLAAGAADNAARRRVGLGLIIASVVALWLLATPLVADALAHHAQRYPALDLSRPSRAQAIVVLGGGDQRAAAPEYGGQPAAGIGLLERVSYAAYVAQHTTLPVLVSGTPTETRAMSATLARNFHVDTRWVEDRSRDTFQNAQFSALILKAAGVSRILLVTDAEHEWRAAQEFQAAGLAVVPAPAEPWAPRPFDPLRCVPSAAALARSTQALYEMLGDVAREGFAALHLRRQTR